MIIFKRLFIPSIIVASSLVLSGCAGGPAVEGSSVLVTPVSYHYSVVIKNNRISPAKKEISAYLGVNKQALLAHGAEFTWNGSKAKKLAQESYQWLVARGASPSRLKITEGGDSRAQSLTISTQIHQIQTPLCGSALIGNYHTGTDGCHVDSLRWASMVYPESKMAGQVKTALVIEE